MKTHKSCKICHHKKPVTEFHRDNNYQDGYQLKCKSCARRINREYYARNRDKLREKNREALRTRRARGKDKPAEKPQLKSPAEVVDEVKDLNRLFINLK